MIGGSSSGRGWEVFSPSPCPYRLWGPPSLLFTRYQLTLSLEVQRTGRESDHSPPSSVEVKNVWSYTSTPPIRLHGMCSVEKEKHMDNFISSRSQKPRDLSHILSSTARTLGSRVRIPLGAWVCVRVFLCYVVLCR
jgi:hypothetical protein